MERFPLRFGFGLSAAVAGLIVATWLAAPPGMRWLGDMIHNPDDVAIYLSYIRQGADGRLLLTDLYAVEPSTPRFDLVWSSLGLVAHLGVNPILVHELSRAAFIVLLAWSVWAAARSVTHSRRDARLATILAFGGVSTGWLYSVWLGLTGRWVPTSAAAPDLVSPFAFGPSLLGGSNVILSMALLATSVRLLWEGLMARRVRTVLLGAAAGLALLQFHPYFAPLLAVIGILAVGNAWHDAPGRIRRLGLLVLCGIVLLPPVAYYAWLYQDPVFAEHHLLWNVLPLSPAAVWLVTLLPFLAAGVWMHHQKRLPRALDWRSAWILAAVLVLLFFPVPWQRKLTEGLIIPLVFLTLPAWFAVRDWASRQSPKPMRLLLSGLLLLSAWFGPLNIVASQLSWVRNPEYVPLFYQPDALYAAADEIRFTTSDTDVLLSDDLWVDYWIPALTGRRVYLGPPHETPSADRKEAKIDLLLRTTNPTVARMVLREAGVTRFITTSAVSRAWFENMLGPEWHPAFSCDDVTVWERP